MGCADIAQLFLSLRFLKVISAWLRNPGSCPAQQRQVPAVPLQSSAAGRWCFARLEENLPGAVRVPLVALRR